MKQDHSPSRAAHILHLLGGQSAPLASSGIGRQLLLRCPDCQRVWLQDGARRQLDFAPGELEQIAQALSAQMEALPLARCRLCTWQQQRSLVDIDEYGSKDGDGRGFGLVWEAPEPVGAHLQAAILAQSWFLRHPLPSPDIITSPARLRAVLRWLCETTHFPLLIEMTEEIGAWLAAGSPPGFGMTGTENWRWKGGLFQLPCPPLHDEALVFLAIALPPREPLVLADLVTLWQKLADLLLLSGTLDQTP